MVIANRHGRGVFERLEDGDTVNSRPKIDCRDRNTLFFILPSGIVPWGNRVSCISLDGAFVYSGCTQERSCEHQPRLRQATGVRDASHDAGGEAARAVPRVDEGPRHAQDTYHKGLGKVLTVLHNAHRKYYFPSQPYQQSIMIFNAKSIKQFNALPRKPRAPSGMVSNNWHFDLRYVPLDPTPSHFLFIVQLESSYIHGERIPLNLPANATGIEFFPETGEEAAPEVAKALIYSFLDGFGERKFTFNPPPPYAPWKLTTEDPSLAEAIGNEFRRLGVRPELCKIDVVKGKSLTIAQKAFEGFWDSLKTSMGITGLVSAALTPPGSIVFKNLCLSPWVGNPNDDETTKALAYTQRLATARPLSEEASYTSVGEEMMRKFRLNLAYLQSKSNDVVRVEADAGKGESAIDFSLRLQFGINCTPSRSLCRTYLVKAITSTTSTPAVKSRAHALLLDWYTRASNDSMYYRYLHAAAHHANESALLSNGDVCPAVLAFAMYTLEPHSHQVMELLVQYKAVWAALEKRKKELEQEKEKAVKKRAETANRYICAVVSCVIQADKGMVLARCSGKCDPDKKPAYCSKECQRADWMNHKPFCRPGAPCSVLEKDIGIPLPSNKGGSLSIPVPGPDGKTMMVSSSTLGPEMLKEIRGRSLAEHSQAGGPSGGVSGGFSMEIGEIFPSSK